MLENFRIMIDDRRRAGLAYRRVIDRSVGLTNTNRLTPRRAGGPASD